MHGGWEQGHDKGDLLPLTELLVSSARLAECTGLVAVGHVCSVPEHNAETHTQRHVHTQGHTHTHTLLSASISPLELYSPQA